MLSEDMDDVLTGFFRWANTNAPEDIGYPHIDPVRRLLGGMIGAAGLSDDEALQVNQALCYLKTESPDMHNLIVRYYRDRKTISWLSARGEGDRRTITYRLQAGREFVRGFLFGAMASS